MRRRGRGSGYPAPCQHRCRIGAPLTTLPSRLESSKSADNLPRITRGLSLNDSLWRWLENTTCRRGVPCRSGGSPPIAPQPAYAMPEPPVPDPPTPASSRGSQPAATSRTVASATSTQAGPTAGNAQSTRYARSAPTRRLCEFLSVWQQRLAQQQFPLRCRNCTAQLTVHVLQKLHARRNLQALCLSKDRGHQQQFRRQIRMRASTASNASNSQSPASTRHSSPGADRHDRDVHRRLHVLTGPHQDDRSAA